MTKKANNCTVKNAFTQSVRSCLLRHTTTISVYGKWRHIIR